MADLSNGGFPDGVERYKVGTDDEGEQCARCGSSVASLEIDSIDLGLVRWWACLSGEQWCETHPMHGRENVAGAGRAPRVGTATTTKGQDK